MKLRENFFFFSLPLWCHVVAVVKVKTRFFLFIRIIQSNNEGLTRFPVCPYFILSTETLIDNLSSDFGLVFSPLNSQVTLMLKHIKWSMERENFKFSFILKTLRARLNSFHFHWFIQFPFQSFRLWQNIVWFHWFSFHVMFIVVDHIILKMKSSCQIFAKTKK
jgi:hypothetical protein